MTLERTAPLLALLAGLAMPAAADAHGGTFSRHLGDFNGDGRDDVLLRRDDGHWYYYAMDGRRYIPGEQGAANLTRNPGYRVAGIGDFDGDGKADVLMRHTDGRWYFYAMDGRRYIPGRQGPANLTRNLRYQVAGIGDFNGDGADDVLMRRDDGHWYYYPMNGRRYVSGEQGPANLTRNLDYRVAGIGDFDGDGKDDVLMRRDDGRWYHYAMDGRRYVPGRQGIADLTRNLAYRMAAVGDFDGDGKDDVLLRRDDGHWYHYGMDGRRYIRGTQGAADLTRNLAYEVAGVGDLDGDGSDDVLMRNLSGVWYYYPMQGRSYVRGGQGRANLSARLAWSVASPIHRPVANEAPVLAIIADRSIAVGESARVDIAIEDADPGDTHLLAAEAGDGCVAETSIDGTALTVDGRVAGTATIAVTATDSRGAESGAVSFQVTVLPTGRPSWALSRAAPAAVETTPCAVDGVLSEVFTDRAMQSALLLVDGQVVGERYAPGHDHESLGTSWSVAKSFYSAAIGVAIDEGDIESLEQRASDFLTEWLGTNKENITIRQILEMRSGLGDGDIFPAADQTQFALNQRRIATPGTRFIYSNPNSQLFEPLLRRATGLDAHDWLTRKPIGVDPSAVGFWVDPTTTQPLTYCCLDMRPDDFARFGLLYLNGGAWNGEQIVSEGYVAQSLAAQSAYYGFQWWVLNSTYFYPEAPPIDVVAAHGLDGQHIYLWRDANVALVVLTRYIHDQGDGYVLSLANWPNTCDARRTCPGSTGAKPAPYDEYRLIERLAAVRP